MNNYRNLSLSFYGAIGLLALFTLVEFLILAFFIHGQDSATTIINLSGRQRMLSQRTALLATEMLMEENANHRHQLASQLRSYTQELERMHTVLTHGSEVLGVESRLPPEVHALYFEPPVMLDDQMQGYVSNIRAYLKESEASQLTSDNPHYRFIAEQSAPLLQGLDKMVKAYEAANRQNTWHIKIIAGAVMVTTLAAIILLALLLFRPLAAQMVATHRLTMLLQRVTAAANEAASVEEATQAVIERICHYTGWQVGNAYRYRTRQNRLYAMPVWHDTDADKYRPFHIASECLQFEPGHGIVGQAFSRCAPVWMLDVTLEEGFLRKESAYACGLKSGFAFPVMVGKRVVMVLEFYAQTTRRPDARLAEAMSSIADQLGRVVERTRSQQTARLLETAIAGANDGIMITRADLKQPEIIYTNAALTRITGYTSEELVGKTPSILQGPDTDRDTLNRLKTNLSNGEGFKGEILNYAKNGNPYWLDVSIVPVHDAEGNITHFAAIERDITERKEAEARYEDTLRQLRRANLKAEAAALDLQESLQAAQAATHAKSDFLANMSHELRTPMNGVLGMAGLLADTQLNAEQKDYVKTINGSAETLLMLLNDILDFSKIEAGELTLEHIPYELHEHVVETIRLLQHAAGKKDIRLELEDDPALPSYLWGDPGRLKQVMTNLLGNAIKFTDHGYVRLKMRLETDENDLRYLYGAVEDTGIGIPEDKLEQIFDKFSQADNSVTRKFGGTGLGLAITRQLVGLMGGKIGVESAPGKGSTFWFRMPLKEADAESVAKHRQIEAALKPKTSKRELPVTESRVLLVEDYPVNQKFALKLLGKLGFSRIDLAENGEEALTCWQKQPYDMIFMDCQMPLLDGYETTRRIRVMEKERGDYTPIVAMTANAMMGDREDCLKAGMDDYTSKPLRPERLLSILHQWFSFEPATAEASHTLPAETASAEETGAETRIMDWEHLAVFTDGDAAEEADLFAFFIEQSSENLDALEASLHEATGDDWRKAAHRFKGASANLGAVALSAVCARAEQHYTVDTERKAALLESIRTEFMRLQEELKQGRQTGDKIAASA